MMAMILGVAAFLFSAKRLLRYLRYLQQEDYDSHRFLKWITQQWAFDKRGTLTAISAALLPTLFTPLFSMVLLLFTWAEENPKNSGKKPLKMTPRAIRIFGFALALYGLTSFLVLWSLTLPWTWAMHALLFQLTPLWLCLACLCLSLDETRRQKQFIKEAKQLLSQVDPFVIGITGSYGKTSTKDALQNLLNATVGATFWPAKGINTPMGITREIRNSLKQGMQYAVIEMGAYGIGSIKRLCQLTPPHAAIITSIGTAHLERFGSTDNIRKAKGELAEAVPSDGILVCNGDDAGARAIARDNPKRVTLFYGFDRNQSPLHCWIHSDKTTPQGTHFQLHWEDKTYHAFVPLFGKTSLSNAAAAFTMACALGAQPEYALAAMHHLVPVDNRLEVKKEGNITYLRDAYNSNPLGFASALDVMTLLPGKRRILMTPGMIELGPQQVAQHENIGRKAAQLCDLVLIVGTLNKEALTAGLTAGGMKPDQIHYCRNRTEAFTQLHSLVQEDDIVLIENDFADLHETKEKF